MALGVTVISIVFIFGFKPTEFISDFLYDRQEKKNERKEERAVAIREQRKQEERRPVKSNKIYNVEEDIDIPRKETKKERRLREEEERRRQALEVDQLTINNLEEETESKGGLLKKFKHNKDDIVPLGMKDETSKQAPEFIEENLFKQEQETKEEKVKEVLQLEHTLTVEDENYEYPPIELLGKPAKKALKGGAKALTDTATKLQKTLYFLFAYWGQYIKKNKENSNSVEVDYSKYNEYLFDDDIEAWTYGPVVPSVFYAERMKFFDVNEKLIEGYLEDDIVKKEFIDYLLPQLNTVKRNSVLF